MGQNDKFIQYNENSKLKVSSSVIGDKMVFFIFLSSLFENNEP